ncbi:hypothetical protein ABPG73_008967 [Tetrahymena malaccensis]
MHFKKTIIFLSILVVFNQAQSLPGLDYIKSGYDALKLLNDQLGQSKFSIFNLDPSLGENDFHINGVTYKVPMVVQATELSLRRDNKCEGIYSSFSDFQRKYSESISFSADLEVSNITIALDYNHQLESFYEKITKDNKAISVSQSYWSMYSLTTGPAFLMPLNPQFKQSLDMLNKMSKDDQGERQQSIYNQIISSFGTHYVSSVLMGGSAKIYTTLDQNYLKTIDYEEVKNQISIDFSYQEFKFKFGYNSSEIGQNLHEDFKNNSEDVIVFSPEVNHLQDPKAWETWESTVPQKPQPVNTTVSYISDLAYEYPEVQTHLRKSIEFYLKNGKLPSFDDIQGSQFTLKQEVPQNNSAHSFELPSSSYLFAKIQQIKQRQENYQAQIREQSKVQSHGITASN